MKNLYAKGKGKIHPHSPTDALAMLALLPAAVLALTAVLSDDDKELLAYLITRSLSGADADKQRRCRKLQQHQQLQSSSASGGVHSPMFECGCFECYKSFWTRWDSSPDRDLIVQVIEAFEEHLASSEKKGKGERRRRERKEKGKKKRNAREGTVAEREKEVLSVDEAVEKEVIEAVEKEAVLTVGKGEGVVGDEPEAAVGVGGGGGERRRPWPDVMGLFNSRLWSLWSPAV